MNTTIEQLRILVMERKETILNFVVRPFFIVPRLQAFKALDRHGYCPAFNNMQEWDEAIQKMIDAFDLMKYAGGTHTANEEKTIDEGLTLFCKYFRNLWD